MASLPALARLNAVNLLFAGYQGAAETLTLLADKSEKQDAQLRYANAQLNLITDWVVAHVNEIPENVMDDLIRRLKMLENKK